MTPVDPFTAALIAAEYDDAPYTDEQQAVEAAGWAEYQPGETVSWEEFRRELIEVDDASKVSMPSRMESPRWRLERRPPKSKIAKTAKATGDRYDCNLLRAEWVSCVSSNRGSELIGA